MSISCSKPSGRRFPAIVVGLRALVVVVLVVVIGSTPASADSRPKFDSRVDSPADSPVKARVDSLGTIRASQLPEEGRQVLAAIHAGGPFVSRRDGIPFGNREGLLPRHARGYYAEYTVPTPGARTRGARRIIAGRGRTGDFRTSGEYYYTNDHYQTFRQILE